jgi:hypothetical protein
MQVVMCESTARVPPEILRTVQQQLEETARNLAEMDPETPLWTSLRESGLTVEVLGWKFRFEVAPDKLVLIGADPIPAQVI